MAFDRIPPGFLDTDEIKTVGGLNKPGRVRTAKHYRRADGESAAVFTGDGAPIHYWDQFDLDQTGARWREVDVSLVQTAGAWSFADKYADYLPVLPEFADEWMSFTNFLPDQRGTDPALYDTVALAAPNHVAGVYETTHPNGLPIESVFYQDAYEPGVSLRGLVARGSLWHEIQIEESVKPTLTGTYLEIRSEITADPSLEIVIDGQAWNRRTKTITTNAVQVRGADGELTHLRKFRVWDSSDEKAGMEIPAYFEKQGNKIYFVKQVPVAWLQDPDRVFPVFTDAQITPFGGTGDGDCESNDADWNTAHDADPGTGARTDRCLAKSWLSGASVYQLARAFFPVDTSSLPASPTISAANWQLNPEARTSGQTDHIVLGAIALADPTATPVGADFANMTPTVDTMTIYTSTSANAIGDHSINTYEVFDYNASGISSISDSGYSECCAREYEHDVLDSAPTILGQVRYSEVETSGTGKDPIFTVTYTTGAAFIPRVTTIF